MVSDGPMIIYARGTVLLECSACRAAIRKGDHYRIIVQMPQEKADLMCIQCWAMVLAGALIGIPDIDDDGQDALKTLRVARESHLRSENDQMVS